jgi:hypothetical protein
MECCKRLEWPRAQRETVSKWRDDQYLSALAHSVSTPNYSLNKTTQLTASCVLLHVSMHIPFIDEIPRLSALAHSTCRRATTHGPILRTPLCSCLFHASPCNLLLTNITQPTASCVVLHVSVCLSAHIHSLLITPSSLSKHQHTKHSFSFMYRSCFSDYSKQPRNNMCGDTQKNANAHATDEFGWTALMHGARSGTVAVVHWLAQQVRLY